jgi:type IV pilus assembly protein PilY1
MDTSSSMTELPGPDDDNQDCDESGIYCKWEMARDVLLDVVSTINYPDGEGGYVQNARFGVFLFDKNKYGGRLIVPIADDNTGALLSRVENMIGYEKSNADINGGTPLGPALVDVGRYFAGAYGWGTLPKFGTLDMQINPKSEPSVPSPIDFECRKNFVIAMSDGRAASSDMDKYPDTKFCATIGDADGDNVESCPDSHDDWMDDVAYRMYRTDFSPLPGEQNLTVHTVAFDLDGEPEAQALLQDTATHGGGIFTLGTEYDALKAAYTAAIANIFEGVVSFTAPTVPSSRTQGEGAFYYSYFKPESDKSFWRGSLAAYKIDVNGNIVDAAGNVLLSTGSGVIDPNAPSFWEAGQLLGSNTARNLWTTRAGTRKRFNKANVLAADMDLTAAEIPQYPNYDTPAVSINNITDLGHALVDYVNGQDAFDEDEDGDTTELRDAVLGDIFHSSPLLIGPPTTAHDLEEGFGPATTADTFLARYGLRDRVLYGGANDGVLHAFEAGTAGDNPATGDLENDFYDIGTGEELFGYVPAVLLPTIKMMPRNKPRTYYYVDGPPVAADAWLGANHDYANPKTADEWATVLIVGMREGGEGYLALDVTDPSGISGAHGPYPKFLWEFTNPKLAEAWSEPIITRVRVAGGSGLGDKCGYDDGDGDCREQWVAIFGGGYRADGNPNSGSYISNPSSGSWSDKGKGIFMVSLDTGQVLAEVVFDANDFSADGPGNMRYALPSTPAVLDHDFDGFADVVYIGDLGGQMWKWDISSVGEDTDFDTKVDNWPAGVFFRAYTAGAWGSGPGHYHSFFFAPAATLVKGELVLAFGTGEREHLSYGGSGASTAENNRFYVVRDDHPTGAGAFAGAMYEDTLTDVTNPTLSPDPADSGFFLIGDDGEKFVTDHLIFAGRVITTSYNPDSAASVDPCLGGGGGTAYLYVFDLVSGEGFFADASATTGVSRRMSVGNGLPTAPQLSLSGEGTDRLFVKTSSGVITAMIPPGSGAPPVSIIYWRQVF